MLFSEQVSNPVLDIPPHILDVALLLCQSSVSFEVGVEAQFADMIFTSLRDYLPRRQVSRPCKAPTGKLWKQ
jgi:hypothetical protein